MVAADLTGAQVSQELERAAAELASRMGESVELLRARLRFELTPEAAELLRRFELQTAKRPRVVRGTPGRVTDRSL